MTQAEKMASARHGRDFPNRPWALTQPVYRRAEIKRAEAALALWAKAKDAMRDYPDESRE